MWNRKNNKGITTLEYAIVLAVIFVALFAMQRFLQRVVMGKWKSVGDSFGYGILYDGSSEREK
jgi:Flp pilus assembly pilin Flp